MKNRNSKKGFTIVELVIVVAVIGILSAILIPTFANLTTQAQQSALKSDLAAVYTTYTSDAADGKVGDASVDANPSIKLVAQDKVFLVKTNATADNGEELEGYVYASNAWSTEKTKKTTSTAENPEPDTVTLVSDTVEPSTFNGYTVYAIN